jgi:LysM repeat protein
MLLGCALSALAVAQPPPSAVDFANLREDVRGLTQRVGDLSLRIEQLERQNADLRAPVRAPEKAVSFATVAQLREVAADLERAIKSSVDSSQSDTLKRVAGQLEKLANQTNAALTDLAKGQGSKPVVMPPAADDTAKPAGTYVVQKGDSLSAIARKAGVRQADLMAANKISDPSRIVVGQTLILPASK